MAGWLGYVYGPGSLGVAGGGMGRIRVGVCGAVRVEGCGWRLAGSIRLRAWCLWQGPGRFGWSADPGLAVGLIVCGGWVE